MVESKTFLEFQSRLFIHTNSAPNEYVQRFKNLKLAVEHCNSV